MGDKFLLTSTLHRAANRLALAFESETLTGPLTLGKLDRQIRRIDPGGEDREVTLPSVSRDDEGYFFILANAGGSKLTVKDADGTILTIGQSKLGVVQVDGDGAWQPFGLVTYTPS